MRHVFLSYSRTDRPYVEKLAAYLTGAGVHVWYDYEIASGDRFIQVIQRELDNAAVVVVVMTPAARASQWVEMEIAYAHRIGRPLLPLLLEPCDPFVLLVALNEEDVIGGRMPSERFVNRLRVILGAPARPVTPRLLEVLAGHVGPVSTVAWSPDGRRLASAGDDRTVRVWDPTASTPLHTLAGHTEPVTAVVWSPDGGQLASAGKYSVRFWDPYTGATQRVAEVGARCMGWSRESKLATGDDNGFVQVWDGLRLAHGGAVTSVAWAHDVIASAGAGQVNIWDSSTGARMHRLAVNSRSVAWSADSQRLAIAGDAGRAWVQPRFAEGQQSLLVTEPRTILPGHTGELTAVAVAPNSNWLVTASTDGTVRLWDSATGTLHATLAGHTRRVTAIAIAPDGTWLAIADTEAIRQWNPETGAIHKVMEGLTRWVTAIAIAPDGTWLATADGDTISVLDARTGSTRATLKGSGRPMLPTVAIAPDGSWLAGVGDLGRTVHLWEVRTGTRRTISPPVVTNQIAIATDGSWLAAFGPGGVCLLDLHTGAARVTLPGHVYALMIAPDGSSVTTCGIDGVHQWDTHNGALSATLAQGVSVRAIAPDGSWLASAIGREDEAVSLYNLVSVPQPGGIELGGHGGQILSIAWSPDDRYVATAGPGTAVLVWDAATGATLRAFSGHSGVVNCVAWSPDGRHLATAGADGTVRTWPTFA